MALTKEIVKSDVKYSSGNYMITIDCIMKEDGVEVSRDSFRVDWKPDDDPEEPVKALKEGIQKYVDRIIAERNIYNHAKLDTAVTWLNANVTI